MIIGNVNPNREAVIQLAVLGENLYEEALVHNINVALGVIFSPSGNYRNCLRLNCGLPWSPRIEQAMQTLGQLCKRQLARKYLASDAP
jgi:DNA-binding transcriptional MocR family regulator